MKSRVLILTALFCALLPCLGGERVPWTTSRVKGSPEKPYNYRIQRAFPEQRFTNALDICFNQDLQRWFVAEQGGTLYSFDRNSTGRHVAADFTKLQGPEGALYAFTFDPKFAANHFVYVCYALKGETPDGTHVSRFKVTSDAKPELDLASEEILITWLAGGHNGCCLKFGPDGYLYISTGDAAGPNPPDPLHTGQDVSDLLSSLLRIDVHARSGERKYSVPMDNPYVGRPNTRPEIWAFGFRNPWRFGIDPKNGEVWVADVGWELWEMVFRVERGGNYGWSIVEGLQPVHTTDTPGPGPIQRPVKEHPHSEAASITGGFVYHGRKFPSLQRSFLYGDWETGKIWALRADKEKVTYSEELTDTTIRVVSFAEDAQGEPVILDYNGGIYSLETNSVPHDTVAFPKTLSETGLFASAPKHLPAAGVVPFQVNATLWNDYGTAERFLALPQLTTISNLDRPWRYPSNAVLVRTISMEMQRGRPESKKRIETQLLHFNGDSWGAYSYRWNAEQTDATLVPAEGAETVLTADDPSEPKGVRVQSWRFHARAECLRCHNPWCGTALGFQPENLNARSLETLDQAGVFTHARKPVERKLVSPYDLHADLNDRARSYLHINCSHCHRENAGGSVPALMNVEVPAEKMHLFGQRPTRGTLDLTQARVIAPGEPFSSVLLFRTSSSGRSRMPYIGTRLVDSEGITLLREWIEQAPGATSHSAELDKLRAALSDPAADLDKLAAQETVGTSTALRLAHAATHPSITTANKEHLARAVMKQSSNPLVQELFDRFLPAEARTVVSQSIAPKQEVLALTGDAVRGAALLNSGTKLTCLQCHAYRGQGRNFGPDFKKAAGQKSKTELLENILEPSRQIAPEYVLYSAELDDDDQISGIVVKRTDKEVVLRDAGGIDHPLLLTKVKSLRAQQLSAMPEGLLAGLSAQEVADLLAALMAEAAN